MAALIASDQRDSAVNIFEEIKGDLSTIKAAFCHIYLEDWDRAFYYLDRALKEKDPFMAFIRNDPYFDPIREDPRYHDLVRQMNFPDVQNILK